MNFPDDFWIQAIFLTPLAAAAFLWITFRRYLSPLVFRDAPQRPPVIDASDLLIGLGLMLLGMLALPYIIPLALPNLPDDRTILSPLQHGKLALLAQACTQLPIVLFVLTRSIQRAAGLAGVGLNTKHPLRNTRIAFAAFFLATPLVMGITHLAAAIGITLGFDLPQVGHETLQQLANSSDTSAKIIIAFSAIALAPLLEEIIFRALLQNAITHMFGPTSTAKWHAILLTSLLFTVIHTTAAWHTLPGLFALSLILGWLYEKHASLIPSILLHAMFNAFNITIVLLTPPA